MKKRNFMALAVLATITAIYSLVENSWFNSWVGGVVGASDFEVTIMVAISSVMGAIFFIFWGAISDNLRTPYGRRKPLLIIGLITSSFFIFLFGLTKNYVGCLIIDGIIMSITGNMIWATNHSLIPDLTDIKERGKINSHLVIFMGIGAAILTIVEILSPQVNGFFPESTHLLIFYISIGCILAGTLTVAFILEEPKISELPPKRDWRQDIKNIFNIKELQQHRELYKLLLALIIISSARQAFFPLFILFRQEMNFNTLQKTLYFIGMGGGSFLGSFILGWFSDKYGRKKMILITIPIVICALILCLLIEYSFWYFFIGNFFLYFGFDGIAQVQKIWSQDLADEEARGKFLGILNISQSLGRVPGQLLGGLFSDLYGIQMIFVVSAVFAVISFPFFIRVEDKVNEQSKQNISSKP